jgi:hypothetical protein
MSVASTIGADLGFDALREAAEIVEAWEIKGADSAADLADALYRCFVGRNVVPLDKLVGDISELSVETVIAAIGAVEEWEFDHDVVTPLIATLYPIILKDILSKSSEEPIAATREMK